MQQCSRIVFCLYILQFQALYSAWRFLCDFSIAKSPTLRNTKNHKIILSKDYNLALCCLHSSSLPHPPQILVMLSYLFCLEYRLLRLITYQVTLGKSLELLTIITPLIKLSKLHHEGCMQYLFVKFSSQHKVV